MRNQTPQTNLSEAITPEERALLREIYTDQKISAMTEKYLAYLEKLHCKTIFLENAEQKRLYAKSALDNSRYSSKGKQGRKKEIRRRLKHYPAQCAYLITLTIADKYQSSGAYEGMELLEAWEKLGPCVQDFMDELNKLRARRGFKKRLVYFKVPEAQPGRLYPHIHILVPGLRIIGKFTEIQRLWPYGNVDFEYHDQESPADYLTKYISKMDGQEFINVMLFTFHLRMFSMAKGFKYPPKEKSKNGYTFFIAPTITSLMTCLCKIRDRGYQQEIERLTEPRGP